MVIAKICHPKGNNQSFRVTVSLLELSVQYLEQGPHIICHAKGSNRNLN